MIYSAKRGRYIIKKQKKRRSKWYDIYGVYKIKEDLYEIK
jgi:hypothetical protein